MRYLDAGYPPVAYAPEEEVYDPESDPDAPGAQDEFDRQVAEAGRPPAGAVPQQGYGYLDSNDAAPPAAEFVDSNDTVGPDGAPPVQYVDSNDEGPAVPYAGAGPETATPGHSRAFAPMSDYRVPDVTGAIEAVKSEHAKMPVQKAPNWLERIAAGGLGAAAGYSNAARRAAPIDIQKSTEGILHPGYAGKLAEWQSRVGKLEKIAELTGQQAGAGYASQKAQSEAELKRAQAQAAMQHGQYWLSRSEQERNQWKIDPKTGTMFNTVTGAVSRAPQTPKDRYKAAIDLGATEPEARYYALNSKMPTPATHAPRAVTTDELGLIANGWKHPDHPEITPEMAKKAITDAKDRAPRDPLIDILRKQAFDESQRKDVERIGTDKNKAGRDISARRQAEIDHVFGPGTLEGDIWQDQATQPVTVNADGSKTITDSDRVKKLKEINRRFAPELQAVEDSFASAARNRGMSPPVVRYDPDTLQASVVQQQLNNTLTQRPATAGPGRGNPHSLNAGNPYRK